MSEPEPSYEANTKHEPQAVGTMGGWRKGKHEARSETWWEIESAPGEWIADVPTEEIADRIIADHNAASQPSDAARIAAVERALEKYGRHSDSCEFAEFADNHWDIQCPKCGGGGFESRAREKGHCWVCGEKWDLDNLPPYPVPECNCGFQAALHIQPSDAAHLQPSDAARIAVLEQELEDYISGAAAEADLADERGRTIAALRQELADALAREAKLREREARASQRHISNLSAVRHLVTHEGLFLTPPTREAITNCIDALIQSESEGTP